MKAYKATHNMKCLDFLFEVGKTYEIEGELKICKNGFHFCQKMEDITDYYSPTEDLVLLEIKALGDIIHSGTKSVASSIKILRIIPKEEYNFKTFEYTYDDRGNVISETNPHGYTTHYEYDEHNNIISKTYGCGTRVAYKYDEHNRKTHITHVSTGVTYTTHYYNRKNSIN